MNKNIASQKSDILITIIHENADIFADFLAESLKGAIKTYNFPNCLKLANITPLHKTGRKDNMENYRPVNILPILSKILERILFEQISVYFDKFLSDQQCGSRKGYSTQHCLLNLLEKWNNSFDKGMIKLLELYSQISQRRLIVSIMNYLLQNSTHMDLLYLHYD